MKRQVFISTIIFSALIIAFVIIAAQAPVDSESRAVKFVRGLGWQIDENPLEVQEVTLPSTFDPVYTNYNLLQNQAGFDLSEYAGKKLVRYTFEIKNFHDMQGVRANVLVYQGKIVGGDLMTVAIDGFMLPLTKKD